MILKSNIDKSVNIVEEQLKGFIETRYVRRNDDYFIAYLSSQTGCNRGCKFCHLTATKQTQFENVDLRGFQLQLDKCLSQYWDDVKATAKRAKRIHINFMARGEPLNNEIFSDPRLAHSLFIKLYDDVADFVGITQVKFNISTIIPRDYTASFVDVFPLITPTIYYSLYSVNPDFRKKWMPNAMPVDDALRMLKEYHMVSKKIIKIHFALIKGENDSLEDMQEMLNTITLAGLGRAVEFNVVRYNPYSKEQGEEGAYDIFANEASQWRFPVKVIQRVGFDVKASCGMFV
jgi:adenine C2-methylase RlmN of 23S rRNA A2503 and tRNA A37